MEDDSITEIMVNGWNRVFIERGGRTFSLEQKFFFSGKAGGCDSADGSPVQQGDKYHAAHCGCKTEKRRAGQCSHCSGGPRWTGVDYSPFPKDPITMEKLIEMDSLSRDAAQFLEKLVQAGYTILIGEARGQEKLPFLNALSEYIPKDERVITIEDNAELQIQGIANLVRLECRQANIEKSQEITIGDLLKTCLRMRPSRIIVGEVRSKEAAELLQVVNVGNDGSLSTIHANSCKDMISRLETMVLMGMELPIPVIRRQIVSGFDIFVHLGRMKDKSRKVQEISEIDRIEAGEVILNPLYVRTSGLEKTGEMIHREKCRKAGIML